MLKAYMGFLFVRPEICLHLPSDSASRRTPLVFSYILPTTGRIRDFHPLERALAERTTKRRVSQRDSGVKRAVETCRDTSQGEQHIVTLRVQTSLLDKL